MCARAAINATGAVLALAPQTLTWTQAAAVDQTLGLDYQASMDAAVTMQTSGSRLPGGAMKQSMMLHGASQALYAIPKGHTSATQLNG